jgi:hypothetical protein
MATVRVSTFGPEPLTKERIAELIALENRPVDTSDIPESTPEELAEIRRQVMEKRKKQMFSLRLQNSTILWWKRVVGVGYTGVMARLLDEATRHPEWIKECL